MADEHERYETLAVGHVLGGLDAADATAFRAHLLGCRDCRTRVAELRDIAADLAAAERDERARSRVRTEVVRRAADDDGHDGSAANLGPRIGVKHVTVVAIVVMLFAAAMAFWNLHLRTTSATYAAVAEQRGETLEALATGVPLQATFADGVTGQVAGDGDGVALLIAGLEPLVDDERLVAWLRGGPDGDVPALLVRALDDDMLAVRIERGEATGLVVTKERGTPQDNPSGTELVRVPLD